MPGFSALKYSFLFRISQNSRQLIPVLYLYTTIPPIKDEDSKAGNGDAKVDSYDAKVGSYGAKVGSYSLQKQT